MSSDLLGYHYQVEVAVTETIASLYCRKLSTLVFIAVSRDIGHLESDC